MEKPPARDLTERELEVMHQFWTHGPATAAEARDRLAAAGVDLAYVTIANVARGLLEKGFLRQTNAERPFVYEAVRTFEDVSGRLLGDLIRRVFRGSRSELLCRLADQRRLSDEERAVLEHILQEAGA
ncbi:BlaI/MecI/CopY family transcriptional regulator [Singulisphaera sp. PoT]|uniref:BlaI/MecI/CopY family transcriptional regulator n=1 Tax=Singulisphaera sp. PoT TaxID=3411797 RepID=UPI003BF5ECD4